MRSRAFSSALLVLACALTACSASSGGDTSPEEAAAQRNGGAGIEAFTQAWLKPDRSAFAGVTDRPAQAVATIDELNDNLQITSTSVELVDDLECTDSACAQHARVTQHLAGFGPWHYRVRLEAERVERPDGEPGPWRVLFTPSTINPDLTPATTLERERIVPPRAPIVARDGRALTPERDIVRIGVRPDEVRQRTYANLAELLEVDGSALESRVQAAEPDWFVPVIDLRLGDYRPLRSRLLKVPGIIVDPGTRALAPTAEWGRAVIGTVAPATAETLRNAGPTAVATDEVGDSGLQLAYQRRLAGTPGIRIQLVEKRPGGAVLNTILRRAPQRGEPLRTTLAPRVQTAAEAAVAQASDTAAVVVVKASTGEVLAAANGPGSTTYNTAFVSQYAPGSTFKIVSAAALLDTGRVTPESPVACPDTVDVGGRTFHNYDTGITGADPTFAQAFAASCNTTFVDRADGLTGRQLAQAAAAFGIGADWDLGLDASSGQAPADDDLVTRAADMIGQGKVLASPLAMAMVAATVDSGVARTPTLLPGDAPGTRTAPLDARTAEQLRSMMRLTVTDGTADLLDLPGAPVYAKTGTAEYALDSGGTGTNAWIVGFRGDTAFAVFLANGESGGHDAGALARVLLERLPSDGGS